MPDYLFSYESVGVCSKNMLTRKAKSIEPSGYANLVEGEFVKKAIYKITNNLNNKCYIGQSNDPMHRWVSHKSHAKTNLGKGKVPLYDALRERGIENFTFSVIGWFEDYNEKEREYIKLYNSLVPNGYNIMSGGEEPPHRYGEEHHNSVYSQELVDSIIDDLLSRQYSQKEIQLKYGVSQQLVTAINRGATHRKDGIEYPIIKTSKYHICDEDFDKIVYLLKNSICTCSEIAKYFGVDTSSIKAINAGRNHYSENIKYPIRNFRGRANSQSVETILAKRSTLAIDTPVEM